jgi:uncharacterized protein YceK
MKTIRIAVFAVTAAFLMSGCGTICNLKSGDPDIYGGVKKDVAFIQTPPSDPNSTTWGSGQAGAIFLAIIAAEMGLSLVADTLTLPLVVRMRQNEQASDNKAQPPADEAGR